MTGNAGTGGLGEMWLVVTVPETLVEQPEQLVPAVASCVTWADPDREIDDVEEMTSCPTIRPDATMLFVVHTSWFTVHDPLWLTEVAYTLPCTVPVLLQLHTPPVYTLASLPR